MLSVSIAMATYNGQKHIRQQLESLAAQDHPPAELVVTDDASTDETLSILDYFSKSSSFPVRIYRNESRLGYRANFMRAANLCRSDLIAFCDQDDRWYPTKIAACVARFTEPELLLVHHNADVVTDDDRQIGHLHGFTPSKAVSAPLSLEPFAFALGFTQVFRSSLLELSNFWPMSINHQFDHEPLAHDQWFYFLASILGKIGYLNEPLAAYIQHGGNTFGYSAESSHLQKLRIGLKNSADRLSLTLAAANIRAAILDAAKVKLEGAQRDRAEIAAKYYRRLSEFQTIRKKIYISTSLGERLAAFLKLLASGAYGGNWGLSGKSLIKDMCVGVPIGDLTGGSFKQ